MADSPAALCDAEESLAHVRTALCALSSEKQHAATESLAAGTLSPSAGAARA